jgi:hypothetical protein
MITCCPKPGFLRVQESIPRTLSLGTWIPCEGIEDFRIVVVVCCVWEKKAPVGQARLREIIRIVGNLESKANILYHKVRRVCSSTSKKLYFHEFHFRPLNPAGCYLAFGPMYSEKSSSTTWILPARHSL